MPFQLAYSNPGEPKDVLFIKEYEMPEPQLNEALIQIIAAPVNPVDINITQGKYPMKVECVGFEGVGKVIKLGPEVQKLQIGDLVVPTTYAGSWRTHLTLPEDSLVVVPKEMGIPEASTLFVNPTTMYRILKDFIEVKPGDTVIQNGANSACGVVAIQLCKAWGINTVNVVRDRPNISELKEFLKSIGGTYVLTEEEIKKTDIFKTGKLNPPSLGLNCIGGESANNILRHICEDGVLVTYGGMSMEPIRVSTTTLVFKNIRVVGFSMTKWFRNDDSDLKFSETIKDLIALVLSGALKAPPHVLVDFNNYQEAVKNTLSKGGMLGCKYILDFRPHLSKI